MAVTYESLLKTLNERKFSPVYFLHGVEPYYIDMAADWIAANVLTESEQSFNQQIFYGKDTDAQSLINACRRYPLMADKQVIILKEAQEMRSLPELETYMEKPVPSTMLVIGYKHKTLDKRIKLYKLLEKNAVVFES